MAQAMWLPSSFYVILYFLGKVHVERKRIRLRLQEVPLKLIESSEVRGPGGLTSQVVDVGQNEEIVS